MGQPATLVIDIETVGQELDAISVRAREILLDSAAGTPAKKSVRKFSMDLDWTPARDASSVLDCTGWNSTGRGSIARRRA